MDNQETHLTVEQLADYVDGRLPLPESAQVEAHLEAGCPACQQEVDWLRETISVMALNWEAPPKAVRANVQRAFRYYVPANGRQEERQPVQQPLPWFRRLFKSKLRWVTAVAAVLVLFLISGSYYRSWAEGVVLHSASVVEISGTAEFQQAGSEIWEPLTTASQIRAGDKVRTSQGGQVELQFFDNNVTYLSPETEMEVVALSIRRDGEERIINLAMITGQLYSSGWPPDTHLTRLSVRTPQAVVAVQAQGYDVVIDTDQGTEISVIKGCAEIVSYDAATHTSYRNQTGTACDSQPPVEDAPIVPVFEL